jgi:mitochondrial inner membrane protein COX18
VAAFILSESVSMLARRHAARLTTLRPFSPAQDHVNRLGRRRFTSAIQDGFLDFALALPWPPSFPPYSSTIILLTVVSRLAFTIPFSVWVSALYCRVRLSCQLTNRKAKRRQWRAEDLVVPALKEARPLVQQQILHEMRVEQPRGTKEELRQMYSKRVQKAVRSTIPIYSPNPNDPNSPTFIYFFQDDRATQRALC